MRIVYAAVSDVPSRFANSVHVMKMCEAFRRLGHDVQLCVPYQKSEEADVGVFEYYGVGDSFQIRRLPAPLYPATTGRVAYALSYGTSLRRQDNLAYGRDWPALLVAAKLGYSTVLEMHGPPPRSGIKRRLLELLLGHRKLIRLVVTSDALHREMADAFPYVADRLIVARNGADAPHFSEQAMPVWRRENRTLVGFTGHLYPGRGMEIMDELAKLCPWADFHIVGGWPEDVAYWKSRLGGNENVIFHGHAAPARVADYLRAFDVLIAPYQSVVTFRGGVGDNASWVSPLKVIGYMAVGRPIICSNLTVVAEILSHEEDALLCAPSDVKDWAEALHRLKESPQLACKLGAAAKAKFDRSYSWDARATKVLDRLPVDTRDNRGPTVSARAA
jgi:glycosyltransferase involved in cell wall biosynthesis